MFWQQATSDTSCSYLPVVLKLPVVAEKFCGKQRLRRHHNVRAEQEDQIGGGQVQAQINLFRITGTTSHTVFKISLRRENESQRPVHVGAVPRILVKACVSSRYRLVGLECFGTGF